VILPAVQEAGRTGLPHRRDRRHAAYLAAMPVSGRTVNKVAEGRPHIVDRIIDGESR
jgi:carbamoyl-phosphate synthase large subunit